MTERARHTIDCDVVPRFTAAYLRTTSAECAFIEAHTAHAVPRLLRELELRGRKPEEVRWLVVTHAHLDHAAGAGALLERCPNATLLAHPRAAAHLINPEKLVASATRVYGEERFAELYGRVVPIPSTRVQTLDDGATFELGGDVLRVHYTEGHAKHHWVVDDPALDSVYTGDAFGLVYPALQSQGRFAIASTSPIDFDPHEAHRSLALVIGLRRRHACLTHFDAIDDLTEVAAQLGAWVDRSQRWLEQCLESERSAEEETARVEAEYRAALAPQIHRAEDWALLETDIRLNAQGIVVAAQRRRRSQSKASFDAGSPGGRAR